MIRVAASPSIQREKRCCADLDCKNTIKLSSGGWSRNMNDFNTASNQLRKEHQVIFGLRSFFLYAKGLYAAALGIEILCIAAAEIGENTGLYIFGFNAGGIAIAYVMGYALAGFVTFVTILGIYGSHCQRGKGQSIDGIDSCCSVLEQDSTQRFMPNLKTIFTNFASGLKSLFRIRRQRGMKTILKSSPSNCRKRMYLDSRNSRFDILPILDTLICSSRSFSGCVYSSCTGGVQEG
jgi:hypothetical protein